MRKAYLYSIEGVLASMLVVFYLSTLIVAPAGEDWTRTSLSKRSGDLLTALSRTGMLDRIVRQDSSRLLMGVLVAMEAQLDYSIHIRGLPKRRVEMMVAMTDEEIHRTGNTPNSTPIGTGLPRSESGYRTGTIHGVPYAVSDTATNGVKQFTSVNFDFNTNNRWGEIDSRMDEGPYRFGDLVRWCRGYPPCQDQWFRVGYINDSLTLYNATRYRRFRQTASFEANGFHINVVTSAGQLFPALNVSGSEFQHQGGFWTADIPFNGLTLDVNVSAATGNTTVYLNESSGFHGPYEEGDQVQLYGGFYTIRQIDPEEGRFYAVPENAISADILFLDGVQPSYLDRHNSSLASFLLNGNTLFERIDFSGWTQERFEESFQSRLGFEYVNLSIDRSGSPTNVFASQSGSAAAFISSYFYANDLFVPRQLFRDTGTYLTTNITIRGERYRVNTTGNGWILVGKTLNAAENYSVGQTLEAEGNLFRVASTYPLNLTARSPYRFRNYLNATMIGGQPVLELRDWSWNVSEVVGESYNVSTSPGGGKYVGVPSTDCADPYRNASFTLGDPSLDLEVVLSDVDASCDDAYEYVNFDFNGNGTVNDVEDATGPGFSAEGIHQTRQTLRMDNRTFQLFVGPEGRWIYLRRIPPDTVPTMLWKTQAYKGNGNVFYMGGRRFGDDGLMLLRAAIARAAVERYRLGEQKIPGSPSVGVSIPDAISGEVYSSYTVDSVWWFQ